MISSVVSPEVHDLTVNLRVREILSKGLYKKNIDLKRALVGSQRARGSVKSLYFILFISCLRLLCLLKCMILLFIYGNGKFCLRSADVL